MKNYTEFLKTFGTYFVQIKNSFQAVESFSPDLLKYLEENLLAADVSPQTTHMFSEKLRRLTEGGQIYSGKEAYIALYHELVSLLKIPLDFLSSQPQTSFEIKIITGQHSSGVTTTGAKLACHIKQSDRNVFLISNDLLYSKKLVYLRKQITQHNIDVQKLVQVANSVATIRDLLQSTHFVEPLSVIIDVPAHLMATNTGAHELCKLHDMISSEFPDASIENIGVFDAKNGQQFLPQFRDMFSFVGLKSVILTKVDISSKIGCAFAVVDDIGAPITFFGIGEDIQRLVTLNPENFVDALFSLR